MIRARRLRRALALATALAASLLGCQLIVSSAVPDFHCEPGVPGACPEGQSCDTAARVCVVGATAEGGPIDSATGRESGADGPFDGDAGRAGMGDHCDQRPCRDDLICGTSNLLTTAILSNTTEKICTKTCCTSADCEPGFVCFGAGTGGNYCVGAELAKRDGPGALGPGEDCTVSADCRSGICEGDRCLDTCCAAEACGGGTTCRVKSISAPPPARENWVCALSEPDASLTNGSGCGGGASGRCKNDNCGGFPPRCRPTCCNSAQCAELATSGTAFTTCAYAEFTTTASQTKFCFDSAGTRDLGAACNGNLDCASRFCDPDLKTCAAVCCGDSDCREGEACRPAASGNPFLRCVPAATP